METLVDLLEGCADRYGDRSALGLRRDDGTRFHWSYREVRRRSRLAAWRLRALGLQPGDRVLTWSPSTPALPAAYFGAMYARLIYVPLDSRMSADAIRNIIEASGAVRLLLGTGRDAPDPGEFGLGDFPTTPVDSLSEEPDDTFPADWEAQVAALGAPEAGRGVPARVHVGHDRQPEGRDARARQRARGRRLVPQDHPADGPPARVAAPAQPLAGAGGVAVLRDGRRRRHPLRPVAQPAGHLRQPPRAPGHDDAPRPPGAGPVLERDRARGREAGPDGDLRAPARHRPPAPLLGAAAPVPQRPQAAGRRAAPVRDGRRVPAARAPAGVGGHGRHRPPGLRRDRDRGRLVHDDGRPPAGLRRVAAAAGRDADRRRRRDPVPRPDAVQGLLAQPRGDGRGVHRRRLVQERRPRPARRRRAGSTCTAARRTSSSCPTGSTCTPRTSRTRSASPASATRSRSRREPGRIEAIVLGPGGGPAACATRPRPS